MVRECWKAHKASDSDLRTSVAELSKGSMEQAILLPEGLDSSICVSFLGLECHVCVGDFRNWRAAN